MRSSIRTAALVFTCSFTFFLMGIFLFLGALPASASGIRETVDLAGAPPSPIPGHVVGEGIPTRIDARCFPLIFRVNRTADPVPNPLGASFLSIEQATVALRQAAEVWNRVPTSFVEFQVEGTSSNAGTARLDMVNEITKAQIDLAAANNTAVPEVVRAMDDAVQHAFAQTTDFNTAPTVSNPYGPQSEFLVTSPIIGTVDLEGVTSLAGTSLPNTTISNPTSGAEIPQRGGDGQQERAGARDDHAFGEGDALLGEGLGGARGDHAGAVPAC